MKDSNTNSNDFKDYKDYMDNISADAELRSKVMQTAENSTYTRVVRFQPLHALAACMAVIIGFGALVFFAGNDGDILVSSESSTPENSSVTTDSERDTWVVVPDHSVTDTDLSDADANISGIVTKIDRENKNIIFDVEKYGEVAVSYADEEVRVLLQFPPHYKISVNGDYDADLVEVGDCVTIFYSGEMQLLSPANPAGVYLITVQHADFEKHLQYYGIDSEEYYKKRNFFNIQGHMQSCFKLAGHNLLDSYYDVENNKIVFRFAIPDSEVKAAKEKFTQEAEKYLAKFHEDCLEYYDEDSLPNYDIEFEFRGVYTLEDIIVTHATEEVNEDMFFADESLTPTGFDYGITINSDKEWYYGSDYCLYAIKGDEFELLNVVFPDECYTILPGQCPFETVDWSDSLGSLPAGKYFFGKNVWTFGEVDAIHRMIGFTFVLE